MIALIFVYLCVCLFAVVFGSMTPRIFECAEVFRYHDWHDTTRVLLADTHTAQQESTIIRFCQITDC